MKVCIISGLFPPFTRGGAEWSAADEVQRYTLAGHDVRVITTTTWAGFSSLRPSVNAYGKERVYRFYPLNIFSYYFIGKHVALVRMLWHVLDMVNIHSALTVHGILKRDRPDLVITHNLKGLGFLLPRIIARLKIPHIHTLHDVHLAVPSGLLEVGKIEHTLFKCYGHVTRLLFGSPDVVRAPSQWLLDFYIQRGFFTRSRTECRPHLEPLFDYSRVAPKDRSDEVRVLYVGQVQHHKGIVLLLDAWKELTREQFVRARLQVVGNGPLLDELRVRYEGYDSIEFYGYVKRDDLQKMYTQAHVAVVPSLVYENAPTVIVEAHACGIPVIAARAGGIPEMAHDTDILFEAGNKQELKNALLTFINK